MAECSTDSAVQTSQSLKKLSDALSTPDKPFSWILVREKTGTPDLKVLKATLSNLSKMILLTDGDSGKAVTGFSVESLSVAGVSVDAFYGPTFDLMNHEADLKRRFWNDVRVWLQS